MNTFGQVVLFGIGLGVLYVGAESLVKGAVRLAESFRISPLVIGLTLVAFGTSAPELTLDLTAAYQGAVDLAFGDLVGSNIANIGLVLGTGALVRPLRVRMRLLRVEVPIVIVVSLGLFGLAADGEVGRFDGAMMLLCFLAFLAYTYRLARRESPQVKKEFEHFAANDRGRIASALLVLGGLMGLVFGAQLMVYAAVAMAREFGVSELVIGLTIVAIGTSLPELATSVVGALRGEADIVVGNVLGSNIFNILWIMAIVTQVRPLPVHAQSLSFDLPVMIAFAVALVPIMLRGMIINRYEAAVLLVGYAAFTARQVTQ